MQRKVGGGPGVGWGGQGGCEQRIEVIVKMKKKKKKKKKVGGGGGVEELKLL